MKVIINNDAPILIPNDSHRNFVETGKVIPKETIVEGDAKKIEGLRRGEPFIYRLFIDKQGNIIYEKYTTKMETEINLSNATGEEARVITLPSAKQNLRIHAAATVISGVLAYAVAKKMGKPNKTAFIAAAIAATAGYVVATQITKRREITYQKG